MFHVFLGRYFSIFFSTLTSLQQVKQQHGHLPCKIQLAFGDRKNRMLPGCGLRSLQEFSVFLEWQEWRYNTCRLCQEDCFPNLSRMYLKEPWELIWPHNCCQHLKILNITFFPMACCSSLFWGCYGRCTLVLSVDVKSSFWRSTWLLNRFLVTHCLIWYSLQSPTGQVTHQQAIRAPVWVITEAVM